MNNLLTRAKALSSFVRMTQIPSIIRRATGFPAHDRNAFHYAPDERTRERLIDIAVTIRGTLYEPAFFVHGVLPRSGTNYLADAIALHPHIRQNPNELWEFPLLYVAGGAEALQREFHFMFPPNAQVMVPHETLAYWASGWMHYLQAQTPEKHMLFKSPHMQNVTLFSALFPRDRLLILLRDGRDVLQSSQATFGKRLFDKKFSTMAAEWAEATRLALQFEAGGQYANAQALVVRYEDLVCEGGAAMRRVLIHLDLDEALYPWDAFAQLPLRGSSTSKAAPEEKWHVEPRTQEFNPLGRWHAWSEAQKKQFKRIAGDALIAAGYAQDRAW